MTDTATSRYKARQQSQGSNTNTWGDDKLNEVLRLFDRGSKGYQALALGGDTTLNWSNYAALNTGQVAVLKLTGSLSSPAALVVPSAEWVWDLIWNTTGQTVTVKTSAGSGAAIPNGRKAKVFCDGADCHFATPNFLGDDITETNNRDIMDKAAVETAVANAALPASTGAVLVSANDTTAGYLGTKVSVTGVGAAIVTPSIANPGANETSVFSISVDTKELEEFLALVGKVTASISSGTTAMAANRRYRITAAATATLPAMAAGDFVIVEFAVGAGIVGTVARNAQTIDGLAEDDTYLGSGGSGPVIRYDYAGPGEVTSRLFEGIPV